MNTRELKEAVQKGACDRSFSALYGGENVERARERYASAIDTFVSIYGPKEEACRCPAEVRFRATIPTTTTAG